MTAQSPGATNPKVVQVAAAVITRPDGSFLLAQRPSGKVYEGYWEFPGGKISPGSPRERRLIASSMRSWASMSSMLTRGSLADIPIHTRRLISTSSE